MGISLLSHLADCIFFRANPLKCDQSMFWVSSESEGAMDPQHQRKLEATALIRNSFK